MVICFRFRDAFSISPYLPREGPETFLYLRRSMGYPIQNRIATYLPREGPKTGQSQEYLALQESLYSSLSTSRGAENVCCLRAALYKDVYRYLSTSRGAGNIPRNWLAKVGSVSIVPYQPREGPETESVVNVEYGL